MDPNRLQHQNLKLTDALGVNRTYAVIDIKRPPASLNLDMAKLVGTQANSPGSCVVTNHLYKQIQPLTSIITSINTQWHCTWLPPGPINRTEGQPLTSLNDRTHKVRWHTWKSLYVIRWRQKHMIISSHLRIWPRDLPALTELYQSYHWTAYVINSYKREGWLVFWAR